MGKLLPFVDRIVLFLFATSDFVFRVFTTSYFLKQFIWSRWVLIPCIYAYELIMIFPLWNVIYKPEETWYKILASAVIPMAMISSAGIYFVILQNRVMHHVLFEIFTRLALGILLSYFALQHEWSSFEGYTIVASGVTLTLCYARLVYIVLFTDAEIRCLDDHDFKERLKVKLVVSYVVIEMNSKFVKYGLSDFTGKKSRSQLASMR